MKTPVLPPLFNKVAGFQFSCEYFEIFENSFFHKAHPVDTSEKSSVAQPKQIYLFNKYD